MKEYFLLGCKESRRPIASAFAPRGTKLSQDLIPELEGMDTLPFELTLKKLSVEQTGLIESDDLADVKQVWTDYQPNSLAWPLFSKKLKSVIDANLSGYEGMEWISARVNGEGKEMAYFIPRFTNILDVLDETKTIFVSGTGLIVRPVFSLSKIESINVFPKPSSNGLWKITPSFYVNNIIKETAMKANLTGLSFEKVRVE